VSADGVINGEVLDDDPTGAVRLCALADLVDGEAQRFELGDRAVSVVRLGADVYVIGDRCSHADVSLADGEVDARACTVECPKHGSEFDLRTGQPRSLPAVRPVPTFAVSVVDGDVLADPTPQNGAPG
jgi:3-phenylpropionate/trans-cinnamate dioxygenase ferredoxin subunit